MGEVVRDRHNWVSGNAMVEASTTNDSVVSVVVLSLTIILLFDDVITVITHHVSMPNNAMLNTRLFIYNTKLPIYIVKAKNGKRNICDIVNWGL